MKIADPSHIQVLPTGADFRMDQGVLELGGVEYDLYPDEASGQDGYFTSKKSIALGANSSAPLVAKFTQKVNVLSIIFEGLF